MSNVFTLIVPADPTSLRVMRSVASAAAAEADLGFDAVDDLSLAIDEAGGALLEYGTGGSLHCVARRENEGLAITVAGDAGDSVAEPWPPPDWEQSMGALVLAAVAPGVEYKTIDGSPAVTFSVV